MSPCCGMSNIILIHGLLPLHVHYSVWDWKRPEFVAIQIYEIGSVMPSTRDHIMWQINTQYGD